MVAKADTWMPLYVADYLRKTMHLTRDQHGAYMLLLMACWDRGGRLPNDPGQLAGIAKATPAEWRKLAPVLLPFFQVEGDSLSQGRVLEEHEKAARLSEARRQAGLQGGRPRKQQESKPESKTETNTKAIGSLEPKQNETHALVALPSPSQESSVPDGTGAEAPPDEIEAIRGLPVAKACWRLAVKVLVERGSLTDGKARSIVGKLKARGLTDAELWSIAEDAWALGTLDPVPYLTKAAERVIAERGGSGAYRPTARQAEVWLEDYVQSPASWRGERGPRPGQPGCLVDPEILAKFGFAQVEEHAA